MLTKQTASGGTQVGDWIEVRGLHGQPGRRGQVIELLGRDRHERYRVRWDEKHESVLYPADGVIVIARRGRTRRARH
jgi:hypothetical protein